MAYQNVPPSPAPDAAEMVTPQPNNHFNIQAPEQDLSGVVDAAVSTAGDRLGDCPGYMESPQGSGTVSISDGVPDMDWPTGMGY
jgi:hypothetical protein